MRWQTHSHFVSANETPRFMASAGTLLLVQEAMARATRVCIYDPMGMGLSGWATTWRTKHVVLSNGSNQLCGFLDPICPQSPQPSPEVRKSWRAIWASKRMPGPCIRCWAASSGATASFQRPAGSLWWEDRRKTANQGELINAQVKLGIGFHKYRGVRTLYFHNQVHGSKLHPRKTSWEDTAVDTSRPAASKWTMGSSTRTCWCSDLMAAGVARQATIFFFWTTCSRGWSCPKLNITQLWGEILKIPQTGHLLTPV